MLFRSLEEIDPRDLAALATAHELHEMNRLTAGAATPTRIVSNIQAPVSPEDLHAQRVLATDPVDSEGDARVAAAARRWATQYAQRRTPSASGAALGLAAAELAEAVRQEDER